MCYQNWEVWIYMELWRLCWTLPQNYYRVWKRLMQISMHFYMKSLYFEYIMSQNDFNMTDMFFNSSQPFFFGKPFLGSSWVVLTDCRYYWCLATSIVPLFNCEPRFSSRSCGPRAEDRTVLSHPVVVPGIVRWLRSPIQEGGLIPWGPNPFSLLSSVTESYPCFD